MKDGMIVVKKGPGGSMADLSNKALGLMLLVAVVVSVGGTMYTINRLDDYGAVSGRAVTGANAGTTNFTINGALAIQFAVSGVNFGVGYVNTSGTYCDMGTNGSFDTLQCVNFTTPVNNLTIENTGNVFANVSLKLDKNATTFIGGGAGVYPLPNLTVVVLQNETTPNSCATINTSYTSMKQVSDAEITPTYGAGICRSLNFSDSTDSIKVPVYLKIPGDAPTGLHTLTLTAYGCDDNSCY